MGARAARAGMAAQSPPYDPLGERADIHIGGHIGGRDRDEGPVPARRESVSEEKWFTGFPSGNGQSKNLERVPEKWMPVFGQNARQN